MSNPTVVSCSHYDYIEIACMHRYDVKVVLVNGDEIVGRATSTRAGRDKVEYFGVNIDGEVVEVPMHDIALMKTITPAATFRQVDFQADATDP